MDRQSHRIFSSSHLAWIVVHEGGWRKRSYLIGLKLSPAMHAFSFHALDQNLDPILSVSFYKTHAATEILVITLFVVSSSLSLL